MVLSVILLLRVMIGVQLFYECLISQQWIFIVFLAQHSTNLESTISFSPSVHVYGKGEGGREGKHHCPRFPPPPNMCKNVHFHNLFIIVSTLEEGILSCKAQGMDPVLNKIDDCAQSLNYKI